MSKLISVVIPAYNEAKRIKKTLNYISEYLLKNKYRYEIVVVDDGSRDDTARVVENIGLPGVRLEKYNANRGKGFAVNYGVTKSKGDYILFCDADNATPFYEIKKMLEQIEEYPVVIGSRYLKDSKIKFYQPLFRRIASRFGNMLIQIMILPGISDTQCGFKMFQADAAKEIFSRQTIWRWGFDMEVLYIAKKLNYKIKQVPVDWYSQEGSKIQSSNVFLTTFSELVKIKTRGILGHYR